MVKYLNFPNSSFCLNILFNVNGKATVWHTPGWLRVMGCNWDLSSSWLWLLTTGVAITTYKPSPNDNYLVHTLPLSIIIQPMNKEFDGTIFPYFHIYQVLYMMWWHILMLLKRCISFVYLIANLSQVCDQDLLFRISVFLILNPTPCAWFCFQMFRESSKEPLILHASW